MIRITDQYFWQVIFGIFYVVLLVMGLIILNTESRISLQEITVLEVIVIALASYRLTVLLVEDAATKWLREQFWDAKKTRGGFILEQPKNGPRRTLAELFACERCMMLWVTSLTVFLFFTSVTFGFVALILAIAGGISLMSRLARIEGK